jgi:hypothetical protein
MAAAASLEEDELEAGSQAVAVAAVESQVAAAISVVEAAAMAEEVVVDTDDRVKPRCC